MQYQRNPFDDIKSFFKEKSLLSRLILINIVVFLFVNIINLFLWLFQINPDNGTGLSPVVEWFAVPSNPELLIQKPWTLLTYMFLQENFFHLFFNMLVLYFGGQIFQEYLNYKKLLGMYIWGGISGGLLYVLSFNYFPVFENAVISSVAIGASASVLAILIAIATYVPNYYVHLMIFGRVRLKYLAIILVVIDLISIQGGNSGGHIAHIGGAIWGFLYIILLKNGFDLGKKFSLSSFRTKRAGPKKSYTNPNYGKRPISDDAYNRKSATKQKEINLILEKISKSGYSSLSKAEKEKLFKMSNKK